MRPKGLALRSATSCRLVPGRLRDSRYILYLGARTTQSVVPKYAFGVLHAWSKSFIMPNKQEGHHPADDALLVAAERT
jgi:hypothetical protein